MPRTFRSFQGSNLFAAFCLGLLSFLVISGLRWPGLLQDLELSAYDWQMRHKSKAALEACSRITIIGITEEDIENLGRWPLNDKQLAGILQEALKFSPKAVGVDLFRNLPILPGTDRLESVLLSNPEIVMVSKFGTDGVPPPACLEGSSQVGFSDILVDRGGVVRRGLLFLDQKGIVGVSFGFQLALRYLEKENVRPSPAQGNPHHLKLGPTVLPPFEGNDGGYIRADARGYQFLLNIENAGGHYPVISLSRFLDGDYEPNLFSERIILIGAIAESIKDHFYTSFSGGLGGEQHLPGIVLHASIAEQLIQYGLGEAEPLDVMRETWEYALVGIWALIGAAVSLLSRSILTLTLAGLTGGLLIGLSAFLSLAQGIWIPMVPPLLAYSLSLLSVLAFLSSKEIKQRALLMELFSRHVAPEVAESIWRERDQILKNGKLSSQKLTATVLFSDIQGYTAIAERLKPQELIDWLNSYMEAMTNAVMDCGGVVDDYAGDSIKADFGVPLPRSTEQDRAQDALNAVRCALTMQKGIAILNDKWQHKGLPKAGIRVGICTGEVVAGTVGSTSRVKYTTLGDTVNIAARLESFDKSFGSEDGCRILVTKSCLDYLGGRCEAEPLGRLQLQGKNMNVSVYRIISSDSDSGQ